MKIIDLLNDIENDEIEDGTIFEVIGDFFYKLIVIDKNLYCINEITKQLEILDSKYIGKFDNRQYEIIELSNKIEEEKKIPEKLGYFDLTKDKNEKNENGNDLELHYTGVADAFEDVYTKIDEIIDYLDYLKSKGDE